MIYSLTLLLRILSCKAQAKYTEPPINKANPAMGTPPCVMLLTYWMPKSINTPYKIGAVRYDSRKFAVLLVLEAANRDRPAITIERMLITSGPGMDLSYFGAIRQNMFPPLMRGVEWVLSFTC